MRVKLKGPHLPDRGLLASRGGGAAGHPPAWLLLLKEVFVVRPKQWELFVSGC